MTKRSLIFTGILVALCCGWVARAAYRARHDLVTLDVEGMPLRKVVSKLRWQTWEDIRVHKDMDALITLKVESAPLEAVLAVLAQQAEGRWTPVLSIYKNKSSLKKLEGLMEGNITGGWTNYSARPDFAQRLLATNEDGTVTPPMGRGGMGFGGGPGGDEAVAKLSARMSVDARIENASPAEASAQLRRASRARIVSEDTLGGRISVDINQEPLLEAVEDIAAKYGAKSGLYYVLETRSARQATPEMREQMQAAFAQVERPNMEEMRARMEERRNDPAVQERMVQRQIQNLKTTTPEQRAEQAKQRRERGGPGAFARGNR